jgi:hypothetical protein
MVLIDTFREEKIPKIVLLVHLADSANKLELTLQWIVLKAPIAQLVQLIPNLVLLALMEM